MGHIFQMGESVPRSTYQKADLLDAESVGAAEVVGQAPWRGNDHMWLAGELQGLGHHVCRWRTKGGAWQLVWGCRGPIPGASLELSYPCHRR